MKLITKNDIMLKTGTSIILIMLSVRLTAQFVNFSYSTLPIVIINTNGAIIPDDPKINVNMKIIYNGVGKINQLTDQNFHFDGTVGIERRGSSSQTISDKKPYSIEVRDAAGDDLAVSLLGMPKESDWALIAPYSDKALIRDALTYNLAGTFMAWAPRTRFCELVLNGEYRGLYVLTEKIKRDKGRVNISKSDSTATSGDDLTGGYIIKIDKTTGNVPGITAGFYSAYSNNPTNPTKKTLYQYEYPSLDKIKPAQKTYIQTTVASMEQTMSAGYPTFADPSVGYPKYWDVQSLVDFFIVNELTRNVDGYRLSTFFYKDKNSINSKLKMGPVWDFNFALGNANYCDGARISNWSVDYNNVCPLDGWGVPFWWSNLMADNNFRKQIRSRWQQLRTKELSNTRINYVIDSMILNLGNAPNRNFQKWQILGRYVWPNPYIGATYESEITYLKSWLTNRIAWIDGQIATFPVGQEEILEQISVSPNPSVSGFNFAYFLKNPQTINLLIFNELGQIVFQKKEQQSTGNQQMNWFDPQATRGLYFYDIKLDGKRGAMGKIVKN